MTASMGLLLMSAAWPCAFTCRLLCTRQHAGRQVQVQQALDAGPTTRQAPGNLLPCSSMSRNRLRVQAAPLLAVSASPTRQQTGHGLPGKG